MVLERANSSLECCWNERSNSVPTLELDPWATAGEPGGAAADKRDEALLPFLGEPHDATLGARCGCALCTFNRPASAVRVMVADAKECAEGVSFLHVRKLLLVDVPSEPSEFLQVSGR